MTDGGAGLVAGLTVSRRLAWNQLSIYIVCGRYIALSYRSPRAAARYSFKFSPYSIRVL